MQHNTLKSLNRIFAPAKIIAFLCLMSFTFCLNAQTWTTLGTERFSAGGNEYNKLVFNNGTPYLTFRDGGNGSGISVMYYNGTTWTYLGSPSFSAGQASYIDLTFYNNEPYVAYSDNSVGGRAVVMRYDGSNWVNVGTVGFSTGTASDLSIVFEGGIPYVAYRDHANGQTTTVRSFDGTNWNVVGTEGFGFYSSFQSLKFNNGIPYVCFAGSSSGTGATVMYYDGTAWQILGTEGFSAANTSHTKFDFYNNEPYVIYRDAVNSNSATVMRYDGSNWVSVGSPGLTGSSVSNTGIVMIEGTPYIVYSDGSAGNRTRVKYYDGSNWLDMAGGLISSGTSYHQTIATDGNIPYVAYLDAVGTWGATVRYIECSFDPDNDRGNTLRFNGASQYLNIPHNASLDMSDALTMEAWVKPSAMTWLNVAMKGNYGYGLSLSGGTCGGTSNQLVFWDQSSCLQAIYSSVECPLNEWSHVAVTVEDIGSQLEIYFYVNGVADGPYYSNQTGISNGGTNQNLYIGNQGSCFCNYYQGEIDEFRLWSEVRTGDEIRENMHVIPKGCVNDLAVYYQMNEGTGTTVVDQSGNNNTATLMNSPTWTTSTVNVGNDAGNQSNSVTIMNIPSGASSQVFSSANLRIDFTAHSTTENYTVSYQAFSPNTVTGVQGAEYYDNPMWTINKSTANSTQAMDLTFSNPNAPFTNIDGAKYKLYWRPSNSDGNWETIRYGATVSSSSQIRFSGIEVTGQFMIVKLSDDNISDVRGNMYVLDGANSEIQLGISTAHNPAFTMEFWLKPSATGNDQRIISSNAGLTSSATVRFQNNRVEFWSGCGGWFPITTSTIPTNQWTHLAIVSNGTQITGFVNGTQELTINCASVDYQDLIFGKHYGGFGSRYRGAVDEMRFWNAALSENEIRANMHLTLKGNEANLLSYYQFDNDDPVGTVNGVIDALGVNHGQTVGIASTDYIASEVAVAGGVSEMMNVTTSGTYEFTESDVSINFGATNPNGNVWIYRLETEKPHGWSMTPGDFDFDNEYFVIENFGTNATFDVISDMTFGRVDYIDPTVTATDIEVYKRESNDFGSWAGRSQGGANAITGGNAGVCTYNTSNGINSFSQFVLVNKSTSNTNLPIELVAFDAERENAKEVLLSWETAVEINNAGFEVERMLDNEEEFTVIDFVEGYGNSNTNRYYDLVDENSHAGISYYRLKQIDTDGTYTYSELRAVEGERAETEMNVLVYPNPTSSMIQVQFSDISVEVNSTIRIQNMMGQEVYHSESIISNNTVIQVQEVTTLSAGAYTLDIELSNGKKYQTLFIKS